MKNQETFQITFYQDQVIMRTIDNLGFPIDIWRFEKNTLSDNERSFINNMMSMSESMILDRSEKNPNCKCSSCKCNKS